VVNDRPGRFIHATLEHQQAVLTLYTCTCSDTCIVGLLRRAIVRLLLPAFFTFMSDNGIYKNLRQFLSDPQ